MFMHRPDFYAIGYFQRDSVIWFYMRVGIVSEHLAESSPRNNQPTVHRLRQQQLLAYQLADNISPVM